MLESQPDSRLHGAERQTELHRDLLVGFGLGERLADHLLLLAPQALQRLVEDVTGLLEVQARLDTGVVVRRLLPLLTDIIVQNLSADQVGVLVAGNRRSTPTRWLADGRTARRGARP